MTNYHVDINEQEGKDIIKKTFKMEKEPTTAVIMGLSENEGAAMWGVGNTDEVTTLITTFAKQLPEDARYAVCVQLLETIEPEAIADVVIKALHEKDKIPKKLN